MPSNLMVIMKAAGRSIGWNGGHSQYFNLIKGTQLNSPQDEIRLTLLDLIMPGVGGKKGLEDILAFDPSAKVAIASGFSLESTATEMLEMGARAFVSKPFELDKLLSTVRSLINHLDPA